MKSSANTNVKTAVHT